MLTAESLMLRLGCCDTVRMDYGCSVHVCIAIVAIVVHKLHKIVSVRGYFHFETQTFYTDKFHLLQINVRDGIML